MSGNQDELYSVFRAIFMPDLYNCFLFIGFFSPQGQCVTAIVFDWDFKIYSCFKMLDAKLWCLSSAVQVSGGERIRANFYYFYFHWKWNWGSRRALVCLLKEWQKHMGKKPDGVHGARKNQIHVHPMETLSVPCRLYPQHYHTNSMQAIYLK